jgi:hypothetical protein
VNRRTLLASLVICATIGSFFGPAVSNERLLAFRDSAHFYYPLFQWCRGEWEEGRIPLWNPYENCGSPVVADATSSVFYPGKLLFALPISYDGCFNLYIVLHVLLAAGGIYVLARSWRARHAAAALAAIAYSCGGSVVFQYCNVVFLVGAAWLPFLVLAADQMLRRGSGASAILFGVVLALMTLGGDPQSAYHGLLIALLYAAMLGWKRWRETTRVAVLVRSPWYAQRLAIIFLSGCVAFALSAVQIMPSIEATRLSDRAAFNRPRNVYEATTVAFSNAESVQPLGETRGQSIARGLLGEPEAYTHHEAIYEFSVGPWRFAEYLWPNVGGRMFPIHRRWFSLLPSEGRIWTPSLYLGLLPVMLAIGSLIAPASGPREQWLKWLVVLCAVGSLGCYGLGWLMQELAGTFRFGQSAAEKIGGPVGGLYWLLVTCLPGYTYFRYPAKLLPIVALGLCLLGAKGFDGVFARRSAWLISCLMLFASISGLCAVAVWLAGKRLFAGLIDSDVVLGPFDAAGARHDLRGALLHALFVAVLLLMLLVTAARHPRQLALCKWLAVVLTAVDLWIANAWLVMGISPQVLHNESAIVARIHNGENSERKIADDPRVFRGNLVTWQPPRYRQSAHEERLSELTAWERETLLPKFQLGQRISILESHSSLHSADYQAMLYVAKQHGPRQRDKSLTPQPSALRLLGTQYLLLPEQHEVEFAKRVDHTPADWPEAASLWRMNQTAPRAWIVHSVQALPVQKSPLRMEALEERAREVLFPNEMARDFSRFAVVETDEPLAAWQTTQMQMENAVPADGSRQDCQIIHDSPQKVVIEATLDKPGLLVLADAWHPGWQATVRTSAGKSKTTIYRTNRVLRGVWLTAGKQTVEFRYRPASFLAGAALSGISWLALSIVGLAYALKGRKPVLR